MNELRERFIREVHAKRDDCKYLVVAVRLPTHAIEIIINTENISDKCDYYIEAYDSDFRLRKNDQIRIIDFMMVA